MGVTWQHKIIFEHVAKEVYIQVYISLSGGEQIKVMADTKERYLAHIFLQHSGKHHNKLRTDLSNDYTTGNDRHPKTCQAMLHLLDN